MFTLIGTREQREQFKRNHRIPGFDHEGEALSNVANLYNDDDERVKLIIDLYDGEFTVQPLIDEGGFSFPMERSSLAVTLMLFVYTSN